MRSDCRSVDDRIAPFHRIEQMRLPDDANRLRGILPRASEVVHAIRNAQAIQARAEIEKIPLHTSWLSRASYEAAHEAPGISIVRNPAIRVGLAVENVQHGAAIPWTRCNRVHIVFTRFKPR